MKTGMILGPIVCFLLLGAGASAQTTWTVDPTGAGDFIEIQDCIDAASDGDTCRVSPGIYVERIRYNGKNLTVFAPDGPESTIIDGDEGGPVVRFLDGETGEAVLDGFTVRNGAAYGGGGIYCSGASPTVRNCTITENLASNEDTVTASHGGGVFIADGHMTISDCTIAGNTASSYTAVIGGMAFAYGGGIYVTQGGVTITDCSITGNRAAATAIGDPRSAGGGIYAWYAEVSITNSAIAENTAREGGGIYCHGTSSTIVDCAITGNTGSGFGGGGISGSGLTITGCTITGNRGFSGGGIDGSGLTITGCTINGNSASYGGGVRCSDSSVADSAITWNTAEEGGGISGGSSLTVEHCTITWNTAEEQGGGIRVVSGDTAVTATTLMGNMAGNRGGGLHCEGASATITNTIVWEGRADEGAEISIIDGSLNASYSDVMGGETAVYADPGSALHWGDGNIDADPRFCVTVCRPMDFHLASDSPCLGTGLDGADMGSLGQGCALPVLHEPQIHRVPQDFPVLQEAIDASCDGDTILVAPGTYVENIRIPGTGISIRSDVDGDPATHDIAPAETLIDGDAAGSVVTIEGPGTLTVLLEGLTVQNGKSERGGGIYNDYRELTVTHCTVTGNMTEPGGDAGATSHGGGIYVHSGHVAVTNSSITGNTAHKHGGGVYGHALTVTSCAFTGNTAGYGGGIYGSGGTITDCSFVENAATFGGGIYCQGGAIEDCSLTLNTASHGGGIHCSGCTVTRCSLVENATSTFGNGGGIWGSATSVTNSYIAVNTASEGGGIYGRNLTVTNCSITGNTADNTGGGIHSDEGDTTIANDTMTGNTADAGGGVYCYEGDATITNTILWGDTADLGSEIAYRYNPAAVYVSYSDVQGGEAGVYPGMVGVTWGPGNMDLDPLFVPGPDGEHYLSQVVAGQAADSPCVDAGDPGTDPWGWDSMTTRTDQTSDSGTVDIGYHYPPDCTDEDGDGYFEEGGICGEIDCDDTNPAVNPGAPEVCGNSVDDNCNGFVDEGCEYSAVANAEASGFGCRSVRASGLFNESVLFVLPALAIVFLRNRRVRSRSPGGGRRGSPRSPRGSPG